MAHAPASDPAAGPPDATGDPFELREAVAVLERTPAVLRALLAGLGSGWTGATEGAGTWSPFDVVGHLIHGERTDWIPRARIVLAGDESAVFEPFDRFAQQRTTRGRSLDELLDEFASLRAESLRALRDLALTPNELVRRARHPDFGPVTLRQLLATWVVHDLGHLRQIARVMARRYTGAVGPWAAYLPVLDGGRG